jgi:hypothetical protein
MCFIWVDCRAAFSLCLQFPELKSVALAVERGVLSKEMRQIGRALRILMLLRHRLRAPVIAAFLKHVLPSTSDHLSRLLSYVSKVGVHPFVIFQFKTRKIRKDYMINKSK